MKERKKITPLWLINSISLLSTIIALEIIATLISGVIYLIDFVIFKSYGEPQEKRERLSVLFDFLYYNKKGHYINIILSTLLNLFYYYIYAIR